jgi:hypothetical protein
MPRAACPVPGVSCPVLRARCLVPGSSCPLSRACPPACPVPRARAQCLVPLSPSACPASSGMPLPSRGWMPRRGPFAAFRSSARQRPSAEQRFGQIRPDPRPCPPACPVPRAQCLVPGVSCPVPRCLVPVSPPACPVPRARVAVRVPGILGHASAEQRVDAEARAVRPVSVLCSATALCRAEVRSGLRRDLRRPPRPQAPAETSGAR